MATTLTYWQGYLSMFHFLDKYYHRTKLDDLGALLGSMNPFLFEGGLPADEVIATDWLDTIKKDDILKEDLEVGECFEFMIQFLKYQESWFTIDLHPLLNELKKAHSNKGNNILWTAWIDSCLETKSQNP
jgi:hypothetical protein